MLATSLKHLQSDGIGSVTEQSFQIILQADYDNNTNEHWSYSGDT